MNIINSGVCRNKKNLTFVKEVIISDTLKTDFILPLKDGESIDIQGYQPTGGNDTVSINFQFNEDTFDSGTELYIYTADIAGTVISVKEAHTVPSTLASSISLVKRSGVVDSTVVTSLDLSGSESVVQSGTINGANATLAIGDSLRLDELISVAGVKGGVLSIVIELS